LTEERVVTELVLQLLHVSVVVKSRPVVEGRRVRMVDQQGHIGSLCRLLIRGLILGRTQILITMWVLFEIRARGIRRHVATEFKPALVAIVLVEDQHLEHVLTMDQLVLQLFSLHELVLKKRALCVDLELKLVKQIFFVVKY
jgi:hypothetical protein